MKHLFTLSFCLVMAGSVFSQIDGNVVSRDTHDTTIGIQALDYSEFINAFTSNNQLIIESDLSTNLGEINIFDVQGNLSTRRISTAHREEIDIAGLATGIYFVQIKSGDALIVKKVFIAGN